jgi:hypothetical protein
MRWILLGLVAVLAIGANLPTTTQPGVILNGWLVPEPSRGQVLVLDYDPSGTYITGARLLSRWDVNQDGDVDLKDYAAFAANFTGPQ